MGVWIEYNPNPAGKRVGDCAVRAIAAALDMDWDRAYATLTAAAFKAKDMPSSDAVWGSVLRGNGFYRESVPNCIPDECYTAEDFAEGHPRGIFILGFGGHVATLRDGLLMDSWDSSGLSPQFYWTKKGE